MKNFAGNLKSFLFTLLTLFLLNTQLVKAQDCMAKLKQFNTIETGIPFAKITEYQNCVSALSQQSNKDLLMECYHKLIRYYGDHDNTDKVKEYTASLEKLSTPAPKVPATNITPTTTKSDAHDTINQSKNK